MPIRVTVWNEFVHERKNAAVQKIYPQGIHAVIADGIREQLGDDVIVRTATIDEPEHGLTEEVLAETDVLTWWAIRRMTGSTMRSSTACKSACCRGWV